VSIRTLRYYDKVGLLLPSLHTEAGYRLYSDEDLLSLQQILALKFLGFSLEEIKVCLQTEPKGLQKALALQKAMMKEKRSQLDAIIQAIDGAEKLLQTNQCDWEAITSVIQVIQMEQNKDWVNKYFTPEQQKKMEELSRKSYTQENAQKLAEWGKEWSEEDQKIANQQWGAVSTELKQLVAARKDPASPEAQALAKRYSELISQFTQGDPGIEAGLKRWWQNFNELPTEEKPLQQPYGEEEVKFLQQAVAIYKYEQK
jgi:DNA-binding transcriptional MerR regulator